MENNNETKGLPALPEAPSAKSRVDEKQRQQKADIIEALKMMPIVEYAVKRAGVGRTNYYRFRKSDKEFAKAADEALAEGTDFINDMAETGLLGGIKKQEFSSIAFWLKHRHPKFSPKLEITGKVEVNDGSMTPEQEAARRYALDLATKGIPNDLLKPRPPKVNRSNDGGLAAAESRDQ